MISSISISGIRNLKHLLKLPLTKVNIFYGENGSGKTSILEALYFLGRTKSFRLGRMNQSMTDSLISYGQDYCSVVGNFYDEYLQQADKVGVLRYREGGKKEIRINGVSVTNLCSLVTRVPLQLIDSECFRLLDSVSVRRQFLDWGVFHNTPMFIKDWQKTQQLIRQRNTLLKKPNSLNLVSFWDYELAKLAGSLDSYRSTYVQKLNHEFFKIANKLLPEQLDLSQLSLTYFRGWDHQQQLVDVLAESLKRDQILGYTQLGPHKMDLRIRLKGKNVIDILSRGQQKQLITALKICQGSLFESIEREGGDS